MKKHSYGKGKSGGKGGGGAKKVTNKWIAQAKKTGAAKGRRPSSKMRGY